ncbi:MAG TPA: hypothetical protein VJ754_08990 [Anaerolineae bacterium]|nr:hypothetical protein [Anaerolineae bacterium]
MLRHILARWLALTTLLALASCSAAPAPAVQPTARPEPTASPAGAINRIAIIESEGVVYTVDPDGGNRAEINTSGTIPSAALVWSFDSSRLAFTVIDGDRAELIAADAQGNTRASIFTGRHADAPFYLYWSPDNQHVAFLKPDADNGITLQIAPEETGIRRPIAQGQPNYFSWSPRGDRLALHLGGANGFVGTYTLGEAEVRRSEFEPALFQAPAWSPAGTVYLFAREQRSSLDELVAIGDGGASPIASFAGRIAFAWSPDGTRIAYSVSRSNQPHYAEMIVVEADGNRRRRLVVEDHFAFFWSRDSKRIAYLSGRVASPSVIGQARRTADGLAAPRVDQAGSEIELTWHVVEVESGRARELVSFRPTGHFASVVGFFDQYAQSITFWSPDSRYLLLAGRPPGLAAGVYHVDTLSGDDGVTRVGPGEFGIWSWH